MRHYSNRAMRSYFGARVGGQNRPQAINTPQFLIDAILALWPKGIELDPCSNVWSRVPARHRVIAKEIDGESYFIEPRKYPIEADGGLSIDWPNYTYVNGPYRDLKLWLTKPVPTMEHLILCPVRPNRTWFMESMATSSMICWLKPFAFDGHISCYPTPLSMVYWGCRTGRFADIFQYYGSVGKMKIYERYNPEKPPKPEERQTLLFEGLK